MLVFNFFSDNFYSKVIRSLLSILIGYSDFVGNLPNKQLKHSATIVGLSFCCKSGHDLTGKAIYM